MPKKIAMIGAGSVVFSKNLTGDLLQYPEFQDATFTYMDIDADRLDVGAALCRKVADALDVKPTIVKTMDQREAIKDADFVVCMVQVGGFNSTLVDFEIPRKYGLNFTIADTTGPGGLFRALRTFPFMSQLGRDILELANKDCWLLQYSNPMSMNMRGLNEATDWRIKAVGLCHSVQGTYAARMRDIGIDPASAHFSAAGINHMSFFTKLEHEGRDLYPKLFEVADEKIAAGRDAVRYELMKRLGYAVTESSEHNAEYCAHFIPHEGYVEKFGVPIDEYLRRCDGIVDEFDRMIAFAKSDEPMQVKKSHEYGSIIAHSIATGEPSVVYGNLPNRGAIPNLPPTAIVETPTLVDHNGCQPTRVDPLPAQLVNYMMPHVSQHELYARAVTQQDRDAVYQACIADPLTAATLPMDRIVEMCDEMIQAQQDMLPPLKPGRTPSSGKTFDPPTPQQLRASWDAAKKHTSDEEVIDTWHVAGPMEMDPDLPPGDLPTPGSNGTDWKPADLADDDHIDLAKLLDMTSMPRFAKSTTGAILSYGEYDSVHDREAQLRIQSNRWNGVTVYVNHERVYGGDGGEATVTLRQGKNHFHVKADKPTRFAVYVQKANF
jgi:alpha-galactosidase